MKAAARLLLLAGALGVGVVLHRAAPRELDLVYDLARAPGAERLLVEIRQEGALVRRAELAVPADRGPIHHAVKLRDGAYELRFEIATAAGAVTGERPLEVREAGTVVLPLGP